MDHSHLLIILILVWGIFLFEKKGEAARSDYHIRFGIIEPDDQGVLDVMVETTTIPFILQTSGFLWGYSINPPDSRPYTTCELISMPAPPKFIDFPVPVETLDKGRIIKTPNIVRKDYMTHFYGFSEGDPLGYWKLNIYINDQLIRTIRFLVDRQKNLKPF